MGFYKNTRSAYWRAEKALKKALATSMKSGPDNENLVSGEPQDNKFVFTEMEEFVWVQLDQESHKQSESEHVIAEEDEDPKTFTKQKKMEDGGRTEMHDIDKDEPPSQEKEDVLLNAWEAAKVTGLAGVLNPSKDRGVRKDSVEWGGYIPRTSEYWPTLTPKELLLGYYQTSIMERTLAKQSTCGNTKAK